MLRETISLFSTAPGVVYDTNKITTDACAITWQDDRLFAALCTSLHRDGQLVMETELPITCEIDNEKIKYYLSDSTPRGDWCAGKTIGRDGKRGITDLHVRTNEPSNHTDACKGRRYNTH